MLNQSRSVPVLRCDGQTSLGLRAESWGSLDSDKPAMKACMYAQSGFPSSFTGRLMESLVMRSMFHFLPYEYLSASTLITAHTN